MKRKLSFYDFVAYNFTRGTRFSLARIDIQLLLAAWADTRLRLTMLQTGDLRSGAGAASVV